MDYGGMMLVGGLVLVGALLAGYLALVTWQLRAMAAQLRVRRQLGAGTPVSVQLVSGSLNGLVEEVNQLIADAESAMASVGRQELAFRSLIADISHDLRTPLTAIRGYQQFLARGDLDERQRAQLDVAQRRADELGRQIDQLFEYSYLLEAKPRTVIGPVDVSALVAERLLSAVEPLEAAGLEVNVDAPGQLIVRTDEEKLRRILDNLIQNAAKHATGWLRVQVSVADGEAQLVFVNPVGEPDQIQPESLFDRFFTSDRSRHARGTGLGLSIVRLLVDQLGGRVAASLDADRLTLRVGLPLGTGSTDPAGQ